MKVLQIINCAYRATTEEQDDTIVWLTHAMKGAGADLDVLLKGNAVNYNVKDQNASGLKFGDWQQTQPPRLARDISSLVEKDVNVYAIDEDIRDRGLHDEQLIDGFRRIPRTELSNLFENYDQVWQW
jgi:sulfur relay (sulfurtransferase) DsrF/TusC family protein